MISGSVFDDTAASIERRLIEGYRRMSPFQKLVRVESLNRALTALAAARIRARYGPDIDAYELRLRLAALRLSRETMVSVFDWDPVERGY